MFINSYISVLYFFLLFLTVTIMFLAAILYMSLFGLV